MRKEISAFLILIAGGGFAAGQAPATLDGPEVVPPPTPMKEVAPSPPPFGSDFGNAGPAPSSLWTWTSLAGPERGWFQGEFLLWWIKSGPNPTPLATNGSLSDLATGSPGAFGQPGTTAILLGNQNLNYNPAAGLRLSGGYWFGEERRWGLEGSIFFLANQSVHQGLSTDDNGDPGLYRPVHDVNFGENSLFVGVPGNASGAMELSSSSQLWGAEINGLYRLVRQDKWNFNVVGGFRFLDLRENLNISSYTNDFAGVLFGPGVLDVANSTLAVFDDFQTRNQFYGGQLGFQTTWLFAPRWFLGARALVGLGNTHQSIDISGLTAQNQPGVGFTTAPAGALATASNSGHFTHDSFSVVPEAQLKIGYQFSPRLNGFLGYNFLYWSNVVRPGNQVNRTVDGQGIPTSGFYNPTVTTSAPAPPNFAQSGFWAQGLTFGLQFSF